MTLAESDALVALLPHRPPFRFVDAVDDLHAGVSITARYRVTGDEAFLAGHFPGNPVFPGVIQVEALAQAYIDAGILPAKKDDDSRHVASATLGGADVLVSWLATGTPRDQYSGANLTARPLRVPGCTVTRLRDKKIVHTWNYWDTPAYSS